jgi:hypothetical protein
MKTSIKGVTSGKDHPGLTQRLGAFYKNVIRVPLQNNLPSELFTYGVPYEACRTYRTMKSEFECKRNEAIVEAHARALLH